MLEALMYVTFDLLINYTKIQTCFKQNDRKN